MFLQAVAAQTSLVDGSTNTGLAQPMERNTAGNHRFAVDAGTEDGQVHRRGDDGDVVGVALLVCRS